MRLETGVILRRAAGITFIALGIPALPMPIISGFFFIIIGLYLLSLDSRRFRVYLERLTGRNHHIAGIYKKIDDAIKSTFHIKKP